MSPDTWFPVAGALLTCSIGLVGVLAPRRLLTATRLEFLEGYAITEARSTFTRTVSPTRSFTAL